MGLLDLAGVKLWVILWFVTPHLRSACKAFFQRPIRLTYNGLRGSSRFAKLRPEDLEFQDYFQRKEPY